MNVMRSADRQRVWDMTGGTCFYCRNPMISDVDIPNPLPSLTANRTMQVDHKDPRGKGGLTFLDNIVPACRACNAQKHNRTAEEYRAVLFRLNIVPRFFDDAAPKRDWLLVASLPAGHRAGATARRFGGYP